MNNKRILGLLLAGLLGSCAGQPRTEEKIWYVSIPPLKEIVGGIVGDDFPIEVLVPPGASPETYEPTPRQFVGLNRAELIFNVGWIDFETALLQKIDRQDKIVELNRGIEPIAGSCAHKHTATSAHPSHSGCEAQSGGEHGIDPHVWTSPRALQRMAANAYEAIRHAYPDSTKYTTNYERLQKRLAALDERTSGKLARHGAKCFIIYHPALTYYARDYGLEQIAIEDEGKEPSARRLGAVIRQARSQGIRKILYQNQFPVSVVETVARDIDAAPVAIDPLREDVIDNIDSITDLIANE